MRRFSGLGLIFLLAFLAALPAAAQETIRGNFDGQVNGGNTGTGVVSLSGWALAATGVRQVIIQVDGVDVGAARFGTLRPDVERTNPGFPDSGAAGFGYNLDSTPYPNGRHTVTAKIISQGGRKLVLRGKEIRFNNNTTLLVPFGRLESPARNAEVFGTCDPGDPVRRLTPVTGWVLDLGVETNDAGVGYVELMVDNQPIFNTRTGCRFIFAAGGFTNCYGLFRPDIETLFPFAKDAPNAGFRFVMDIGLMVGALGYVEGSHLLTIRSGDTSNQIADVDEIPVVFRCAEGVPNEGSFGEIESPRPGLAYSGNLRIQGWALDAEGIDRVRVFIDGEPIGLARYGADDGIFATRPGVFSQYIGFPDVEAPVFRLVPDYDTTQLSDGFHHLQVRVWDVEGDRTLIGEVTFFVDNSAD